MVSISRDEGRIVQRDGRRKIMDWIGHDDHSEISLASYSQ